ncbi:MAG TPA: glycosyl transferase family protein [Thiomicrospira sp.]|jgi:anthranilate phosphoribosyltransferase|nr:glycosyl transferase family protein [Thiomicrospira sp.]
MKDHPFSQFLRILGKGPKSKRSLTIEEAQEAIEMILSGDVTEKQLGAFLLLMRANGESLDELMGFVSGLRKHYQLEQTQAGIDLDISAYAGKWRYPPYFLLSVKLLVESGYKVIVHGDSGQFSDRQYAETFLKDLGFHKAGSLDEAGQYAFQGSLVYLPLKAFAKELSEILHLKSEIGVRTVFNTAVKLLNPLNARYSIQGIFHKGVENLHHAAFKVNGADYNLVFKGEGGEPEIRPDALNKLYFSDKSNSELQTVNFNSITERNRRPDEWNTQTLLDVWQGKTDDSYGIKAVVATTAVALMLIERLDAEMAIKRAEELWLNRQL